MSDGPDGRMSGRLDDLAKGPLNLVGPKGAPTIDLKVPIAMIALGVDFAVHAMRRCLFPSVWWEKPVTGG